MNRGRIKWDVISHVLLPEYKEGDKEITLLTQEVETFWSNYAQYLVRKREHKETIAGSLGVEGEDAHKRWLAYKPPE